MFRLAAEWTMLAWNARNECVTHMLAFVQLAGKGLCTLATDDQLMISAAGNRRTLSPRLKGCAILQTRQESLSPGMATRGAD